jgi:hypothetical protein
MARVRMRGAGAARAHLHLHLRDARELADDLRRHAVHDHLRGGRLTGKGKGESHLPFLNGEVAHEAKTDDVFLLLGILHRA